MEQLGISLYLGSGETCNREVIAKAQKAKMQYAFTSLHIPEETVAGYATQIKALMQLCKEHELSLMIDVGPRTVEKLELASLFDLKQFGIQHLRIDYGFSLEEIVELAKEFYIILNASTLLAQDMEMMVKAGIDLQRIMACHNFYPKPLTGLSIEKTREINDLLHSYGIRSMGFVSSDDVRRGPLHLGLPTVEDHRDQDVLKQVLELKYRCRCDMILVGDIDLSETSWRKLEQLQEGYISLQAEVLEEYQFVCDKIHHDRVDFSPYVIRSVESRVQKRSVKPDVPALRPKGTIFISNENYLRYEGELEIARCDLQGDHRVNVIGNIQTEDLPYLDYIQDGFGFQIRRK